jgi:hypothetical protein
MNDENIQLWKNPDLVLDYHNFWSQNHLFAPYIIPPVPEESIRQYEHGLRSCAPRIEGNRPRHVAAEIIRNNQVSLTNVCANESLLGQSFKLTWSVLWSSIRPSLILWSLKVLSILDGIKKYTETHLGLDCKIFIFLVICCQIFRMLHLI